MNYQNFGVFKHPKYLLWLNIRPSLLNTFYIWHFYRHTPSSATEPTQTDVSENNIMEELNVSQWLVFKKPEEDGPLVRGGHADALVVHATNAVKNGMLTN